MDSSTNNSSHIEWLASLFCVVLLFIISMVVFGPAGDDDGHITYTAAKNFADHWQVTNHNGEWVEQGSSLLHVFLLGIFYKLAGLTLSNVNIAAIGPLFSLFFAGLCVPLTYSMARRLHIRQPLYASLLLSLSTGFTYWAMGGLESTLVTTCVLYYLFSVYHFIREHQPHYFDGYMLTSTLCFLLVRPESFFVLTTFLMFFSALLVLQGKQAMLNRTAMIAAYAIILFAAIAGLRYSYYGQIFPQPVYAKAEGLSPMKFASGVFYFVYSAQLSLIIYTLSLWGIFRKLAEVSPHILAAFSFCLAYLAFIVASGGDWMAGGRFFVPIIPLLIILTLFVYQKHPHFKKLLVFMAALCVVEITVFSFKLSAGMPPYEMASYKERYPEIDRHGFAWSETNNLVHLRDIPVINALNSIIDTLPPQQKPWIIASIQMGMVPFHLRNRYQEHVYIVDIRGLTTQHLSQCPALSSRDKTWSGIAIRYQDYFDASAECSLPRPDIIYDLLNRQPEVNADRLDTIQREGYTIVYRQQGNLMPEHGLKRVDTDTFIAVSPAIYAKLPEALRDRKITFGTFDKSNPAP